MKAIGVCNYECKNTKYVGPGGQRINTNKTASIRCCCCFSVGVQHTLGKIFNSPPIQYVNYN